ncbi:MAG TPA: nucleotidyl transferase AbiEii/AbiGii toxin family protein [Rhabdochlamydiaceae bacterium]|nr:nucleotidyl transferase AbiEii/AbiGii toxin family protein [Rhabdochlamydiaceae bacterium]
MNNALQQMLERYQSRSWQEHEQALREIIQEISLVGLWRGKFFEHAAFYGGTALRIFYGLDRFSEDLDFTLLIPNPHWSWQPYGKAIINELSSYGFEVSFEEKDKKSQTPIKSAFLKTPTVQELMKIGVHSDTLKGVHRETLIRVKIEIDTNPPLAFPHEQKFLSQPLAVSIRCVKEESLFAGKMHAALFRAWKGRVKGRDWYDMIWFIRRNIPLNLSLFSQLTNQSLNRADFLKMAKERIDQLNVPAAIEDAIHFVRDQEAIERTWSKDFFHHWIDRIQTV